MKSCFEVQKLCVQSTYMHKAQTGQSKARAGSAFSEGSAFRFTSGSLKGVVGTLGTYPGWGLRIMWESVGPNSRHDSLTENACRSPTLLVEASAVKSTVFIDRVLGSADCIGSKGVLCDAVSTRGRSQEDTGFGRRGSPFTAETL